MKKIMLVCGSHRSDARSLKVTKYLRRRFRTLLDVDAEILDLHALEIPLWNEGVWSGAAPWDTAWAPIAGRLRDCDGLVTVAPEWAGMAPPGLKNFLLLCGPDEVGHKPNLLVGVSASRGGAYPIAELRASGYKNNKLCHVPDHLIVRDVGNVLDGEQPASEGDVYIRERIDWTLRVFALYVEALRGVREHAELLSEQKYRFGM